MAGKKGITMHYFLNIAAGAGCTGHGLQRIARSHRRKAGCVFATPDRPDPRALPSGVGNRDRAITFSDALYQSDCGEGNRPMHGDAHATAA